MENQIIATFLALSIAFTMMALYITEKMKATKGWRHNLGFILWLISVGGALSCLYPVAMYLLK